MAGFKRLLLLCICCTLRQHTIAVPEPPRTYAVVIGISKYQNPGLSTLRFADRDASLFASHLQSVAGGNVPAGNIRLLLNENAGIAAIYDALNWLQEHCGKNDKAYFYFSGHGDVETDNKLSLGYLLAYNSPPNNYRNNAITIEDLNKVANRLSTENNATVVLVTDACHTGKLAGDYYKGKQLVASQLRQILNNEVRLAACGEHEEAAEGEDWGGGRGVFSYYLLQGLNGLADLDRNDTIQFQELNRYLDSAFTNDKILIRNAHQQRPALDGNPYYGMAKRETVHPTSLIASPAGKSKRPVPPVVQIFGPLPVQPIDYLFTLMKTRNLQDKLRFGDYGRISPDSLPLKIVDGCIRYQQLLDQTKAADTAAFGKQDDKAYFFTRTDSLQMLKSQFLSSRIMTRNFNERFIQLVHSQAQDMINAYLAGDLSELEKRQYYSRDQYYTDFMNMLRVARQICPEDHFLFQLLNVHEAYLSGLSLRLQMVTAPKLTALLDQAFEYQQKALKLEPYAAYIHNELGNLYMLRKKYALADRHFDMATELSPTWAIPWSNKIRVGLATRNLKKALQALQVADSLQPDLSYSFVNAGIAMEQHGNLLAAEAYFLKAIRENDRHFLPYERLGNIYTNIGDYGKADWYLTEATLRKQGYSINMDNFVAGIAEGRNPPGPPDKWYSCDMFRNAKSPASRPYVQLLETLRSMKDNPVAALQTWRQPPTRQAQLPFMQHYRGKLLYNQQKWAEAEPVLQDAIRAYQSDASLAEFLQNTIGTSTEADTCLLKQLMEFQYNVLEDHYLLAAIWEHLKQPDKALERYRLIMNIENRMLKDQAALMGDFATSDSVWYLGVMQFSDYAKKKITAQFLPPLDLAGYIKLANIYETSGDYLSAEKIYLQQVQKNVEAGMSRMATTRPGLTGEVNAANKYRIEIRKVAEAETFNFYERMVRLFPRDMEWQKKFGLFLYDRLSRAFRNVPAARFDLAYEVLKSYSYPFVMPENQVAGARDEKVAIMIPGVDDFIHVLFRKYDPASISLEKLKLAVRLSGEVEPDRHLLEAIANLNAWTGNRKEALENYRQLVKQPDPDATLRTRIIAYCFAVNEPEMALQQLEILYKRGQTTPAQNLQLADWYTLSGQRERGTAILDQEKTKNAAQRNEASLLIAKANLLAGEKRTALGYLQATPDTLQTDAENRNPPQAIRHYTLARLYIRQKKKAKALAELDLALKNGFTSETVMQTDPAWEHLRKSHKWKGIVKQYRFQPRADFYHFDYNNNWYNTRDQLLSD